MTTLALGEQPLDWADLARLLGRRPPRLALAEEARERVVASRQAVEDALEEGRVCYGVNTGFGKLAGTTIPDDQLRQLQQNLVRSHAAGVGQTLPLPVCRLAFALRIANACRGFSGVRPLLLERLLEVFNAGVVPALPAQGSVGASGDLAPLAHMALVLLGEGRAFHRGREMDGGEALRRAGLEPLELAAKEGLALINGTQVSSALLAEAVLATRRLGAAADVACALTLEAYKGTDVAYDERIQALREHPGPRRVAANLRRLLQHSRILPSHQDCERVQDPYSLRCAPQVHGASRDALAYVEGVVQREVNAVTDNPLVFDGGEILSGGNFHAQPVALAADHLKLAAAEWASISERRLEFLMNPDVSGLPAFLAADGGLQSGLMTAQVTAASLVSENKVLAHPASVDSIPTSAGKEDHVSMAPAAARQARQIVTNATRVLAIELMAGYHGLAFERQLSAGDGVEAARAVLGGLLQPLDADRVLSGDIEAVAEVVRDGSLVRAVEEVIGSLG